MRICVSCMSSFSPWYSELTCPACQPRPRFRDHRNLPPTVPFDCTDGGRLDSGFASESNDCTVRALAVATDSSYAEAHAWLRQRGRKMRHGCHFKMIMRVNPVCLGFEMKRESIVRSKGVRTAIERNPQLAVGTWIIHSTQHVAVLRDGKLLDSFDSSRKIVDTAWRVVPAGKE